MGEMGVVLRMRLLNPKLGEKKQPNPETSNQSSPTSLKQVLRLSCSMPQCQCWILGGGLKGRGKGFDLISLTPSWLKTILGGPAKF